MRRSIDDALTGERGSFAGTAIFASLDVGLSWVEEGNLRWPTYYGPAGRTLELRPGSAAMSVHFADGRFFHDLDLGVPRSHVTHDCAPDRYAGIIDVTGPDSWRIVWFCDGPEQKLVIRTAYRRLAG